MLGSATALLNELLAFKVASQSLREVQMDLKKGHGLDLAPNYIRAQTAVVGAIAEKEEQTVVALPVVEPTTQVLWGSLDGAMMPLVEEGYTETMVGTFSFYAPSGTRLHTDYMAQAPQTKKVQFCQRFEQRWKALCQQYPDAQSIWLSEGALFHWEFLKQLDPKAIQILDFYHACDHLAVVSGMLYKDLPKEEQKEYFSD